MKRLFLVVFLILTAACILVGPVAAFQITLVAEVNDKQQFVADDEICEIDDNAAEDDLVLNYIAQKVKVVGILKETRDCKMIKVESFEFVEE